MTSSTSVTVKDAVVNLFHVCPPVFTKPPPGEGFCCPGINPSSTDPVRRVWVLLSLWCCSFFHKGADGRLTQCSSEERKEVKHKQKFLLQDSLSSMSNKIGSKIPEVFTVIFLVTCQHPQAFLSHLLLLLNFILRRMKPAPRAICHFYKV